MRTLLAVSAAFLLVWTSGCAGTAGPDPDGGIDDPAQLATITGVITDEEIVPLVGARVTVAPVGLAAFHLSATSDALGSFRLERVPAGPKQFQVTLDGYAPHEAILEVPGGSTLERDVALIRLPGAAARVSPLAPVAGRFECAVEFVIDGGTCDNATRSQGQPVFNATNQHFFDLVPGWGGLLFEIAWEIQGSSQAMEALRLDVRNENGTALFGATVSASSPMRVAFEANQIHPSAVNNATIPEAGRLHLTVSPVGAHSGSTCNVQCLRGAGAALEVRYSLYPTFFFGSGVNPDFTSVPPPE